MDVYLTKSEISGEVLIPPSKSVAHRVMIAEALAGGSLFVDGGGKDISATARCLCALEPYIKNHLQNTCVSDSDKAVLRTDKRNSEKVVLQAGKSDCGEIILQAGESGSTLRFLLPVACALGADAVFEGEGRLKDRPLDGLVKSLTEHGANIERIGNAQLPLHVGGKLNSGEYVIDGSVSSQYITGLLFALPLLEGDSRITISGELVSKNYVDITLGVLKDFGIDIKTVDRGYLVAGGQKYVTSDDKEVEGDWSSAGFMLALGALAGEVRVKGLRAESLQGDKIVAELLRKAGADISEDIGEKEIFVAKKSDLRAIEFDAQNCPDAVPVMATVLSFAKGVSRILHVKRLRDKESDRLGAVMQMLSKFGIRTEYSNDVLSVYGGKHTACEVDSYNDHRMAMSGMVCALATEGQSVIRGAECIAKSYPDFVNEIIRLGAAVQVK